mmetsp:Transcript_72444/g.109305  ORF Transcript_72444/g.109305 Transcript_72444/m.109305 type:complete len:210 (-) Transcript_72444:2092-2721(-)
MWGEALEYLHAPLMKATLRTTLPWTDMPSLNPICALLVGNPPPACCPAEHVVMGTTRTSIVTDASTLMIRFVPSLNSRDFVLDGGLPSLSRLSKARTVPALPNLVAGHNLPAPSAGNSPTTCSPNWSSVFNVLEMSKTPSASLACRRPAARFASVENIDPKHCNVLNEIEVDPDVWIEQLPAPASQGSAGHVLVIVIVPEPSKQSQSTV